MTDPLDRGRAGEAEKEPKLSIVEFLDHCSVFIKQHKVFVVAVIATLGAVGSGGYGVGYWSAPKLISPASDTPPEDNDTLQLISGDLAVLSESAQSNFDGQSYFLDALTSLLRQEGVIDEVEAQRLLTGVIVYQFLDDTADRTVTNRKSSYERFADAIRVRYHVTRTETFSDRNPDRGIVLSSELDESILCEVVAVEKRIHLGVKFVARATVPIQNNRDRYSIQVMAARGDLPEDSVVSDIGVVRRGCTEGRD